MSTSENFTSQQSSASATTNITTTTATTTLQKQGTSLHHHHQMDLAPRGPSVVQLKPALRPVFTPQQGTKNNSSSSSSGPSSGGGNATQGVPAGTPIISVNRTTLSGGGGSQAANITLIPASRAVNNAQNSQQQQQPQIVSVGVNVNNAGHGGMPTYQIARVNSLRGTQGLGQPQSITVTPISNK
jgi:hypothetical protein